MRAVVLALVFALAAGYGDAVAAPPAAQASAAAQKAQPFYKREIRRFDDDYHRHRHQFRAVSDYSERMRTNRLVALVGFLTFVLLTLPKNTRGARAFYRQMMEKEPLPPASGAGDAENRQARKVLFFYLLFLLYQLVQFPLTIGRDNRIQFFADLAIQSALVIVVAWSFHVLKRDMRAHWTGDPAHKEKMGLWLGSRLEGIGLRWRNISRMAVGVFVAGFMPSLLARLTGWLDVLSALGKRIAGS